MAKRIFLKHLFIRALIGIPFSVLQVLKNNIGIIRPFYIFILMFNVLIITIEQYYMYYDFQS